MPFAAAPGIVFERDSGKLYKVADGQVTVLFPWPEMRAFRRPVRVEAWRSCDPPFLLSLEPRLDPEDPFDRYCAMIPAEVQDVVRPFAPHHWRMLAWMARSGPGALDLAVSNPALAFMVASAPEFGDRSRGARGLPAPVLLPYRKQREILGWLGFPATESTRRTVRKITHAALAVDPLRTLRGRLFNTEVAHRLAHAPRINAPLLRITADGTLACVSPRLIARIAEAPDPQPLIQAEMLADAVRMWRQLRPADPPVSFDSASRLTAVHDELADAFTRAGGVLPRASARQDVHYDVPFPGTSAIVPLTSMTMLRHEGRTQHNCVASYAERIASGRYAAYRVLEPERCTLGLVRRRHRWAIDQLKGFANEPVSFETAAAVRAWLREAIVRPAAAARPAPGHRLASSPAGEGA